MQTSSLATLIIPFFEPERHNGITDAANIQDIYRQISQIQGINTIITITDNADLAAEIENLGKTVMLVQTETNKVYADIHNRYPADIYIRLEPKLFPFEPAGIETFIANMAASTETGIGTLCTPISEVNAHNPNTVKVALDCNNHALYFSPYPIPSTINYENKSYLRHIDVFAYRHAIFSQLCSLAKTDNEQHTLTPLAILSSGFRIKAFETQVPLPCSTISPLSAVKLVITDVDGVLTDGGIIYDETGECLKRFHVRDGLGIRMLEESGIRVAVLSGRDSATLRKRVSDLGISFFKFGVKDKFAACRELMQQAGVSAEETVCIGDDTIDLPAFAACGFSYAVADAPEYIKSQATGRLNTPGGNGALRELADAVLTAQNKADVFSTAEGFAKIMHGAKQ